MERRRNPNQEEFRKRRAEQEAQWNAQRRQTKGRHVLRAESRHTPQRKRPGIDGCEHESLDTKESRPDGQQLVECEKSDDLWIWGRTEYGFDLERRPVEHVVDPSHEVRTDAVMVPVAEGEAVVENRSIAKEEVVIIKEPVTNRQRIDTDLRHEESTSVATPVVSKSTRTTG